MWWAMNPGTGALLGEGDLKTHQHALRRHSPVKTKAYLRLVQLSATKCPGCQQPPEAGRCQESPLGKLIEAWPPALLM